MLNQEIAIFTFIFQRSLTIDSPLFHKYYAILKVELFLVFLRDFFYVGLYTFIRRYLGFILVQSFDLNRRTYIIKF